MLDGHMKEVLKTGKDGSDSYKDMVGALEKCVKATEFTEDYGFTATDVVKNLKELEKASKEYYKRHTGFRGIFSAHYEDGKKRLETSKYFKDGISAEIEKLKDLGAGLNLSYDDKTFGKEDFLKNYQKQIDDLASNKEFRKLAEKSPNTCISKWSKMVRQQPQVAQINQAPQNAVVNAPVNAPKQKVTEPKKAEVKKMGRN